MRKLLTSLMLLAFAGSALGQYRIVTLNSSQVQGQELKADSITVIWDNGGGRHRWSFMSIQGPVKFVTRESRSNQNEQPIWSLVQDGVSDDFTLHYPVPLRGVAAADGDSILGHQTTLIHLGLLAIHYSREFSTDLKIVTTRDDRVSISEAVSLDEKADTDPRTVDLSGVEEAAAKAEAAGQKDYARQIRRLVRRWQQAVANWP